jgi:hypothetical protein
LTRAFTRPAALAIAGLALAAACSGGGERGAEHTREAASALLPGNFESADGNIAVDTAGDEDWVNAPNFVPKADLSSGSGDNAFGGGSKEDISNPTVVFGSIPPNKSDLSRFYVSNETLTIAGVPTSFLYLAWERLNVLGTANIDFEFNQSNTLDMNGVTPIRTAGDRLVTFDFVNGGGTPVLALLTWVTTGATSQCFSANALPCWGNRVPLTGPGASGDVAEAAVNSTAFTDALLQPPALVQPLEFGEAGINLSKVLGTNVCEHFGLAFVKSRSSASFTAELKDFIAPAPVNINTCAPATINLQKLDTLGNFLGGAQFQLFFDANGNGVLDPTDPQVGSTCTTSASDGIGTCSFTVTTSGRYFAHESAPPSGFNPAPDQFVDVTISSTPQTFTLVFSDSPITRNVVIHKQDEFGNPLQGVVFTLFIDNAPTSTSTPPQTSHGPEDSATNRTCTTDASGNCTIPSVPPGQYWVVETAPPGFDAAPDQPLIITSSGADVTFTFVDTSFHVVVYVCRNRNNTLYPSTVDAKTSISAAQLAGTGLTESALCNPALLGAVFNQLAGAANAHAYNVVVPPPQ